MAPENRPRRLDGNGVDVGSVHFGRTEIQRGKCVQSRAAADIGKTRAGQLLPIDKSKQTGFCSPDLLSIDLRANSFQLSPNAKCELTDLSDEPSCTYPSEDSRVRWSRTVSQ